MKQYREVDIFSTRLGVKHLIIFTFAFACCYVCTYDDICSALVYCLAPGWWCYWFTFVVSVGVKSENFLFQSHMWDTSDVLHVFVGNVFHIYPSPSWSSGSVTWTNFNICARRKFVVFHSQKMANPLYFVVFWCSWCMIEYYSVSNNLLSV